MSTTALPRYRAVLAIPKAKVPPLLAEARVIYSAMLAQTATFSSPVPTLVIVQQQITALDTAQHAVVSGVRGIATATRNSARDVLWASLLGLKVYVQTVADASMENSFSIIKSSGFTVHTPTARTKPVLGAKLTANPGEVKLTANVTALTAGSHEHVTFNWQYSVDGGHTWIAVPSTPLSTTTISGLALGSSPSFRVSVTMKLTTQPWSQAVTIPVH